MTCGSTLEDYKSGEKYETSLKVVNDIAERGIKMITDLANVITTDPKQPQYILQAIDYNRQKFTKAFIFTKACLNG